SRGRVRARLHGRRLLRRLVELLVRLLPALLGLVSVLPERWRDLPVQHRHCVHAHDGSAQDERERQTGAADLDRRGQRAGRQDDELAAHPEGHRPDVRTVEVSRRREVMGRMKTIRTIALAALVVACVHTGAHAQDWFGMATWNVSVPTEDTKKFIDE